MFTLASFFETYILHLSIIHELFQGNFQISLTSSMRSQDILNSLLHCV